jgi:glycine cleavage system H protein
VRKEPDGTFAVGITDHAQEQLGDIVFVEVSKNDAHVAKGEAVGVVESVKAASDIYAPLAGKILEANPKLASAPESLNEDAFEAWIYRIAPDRPADFDELLSAADYEKSASA